MSLMMILCAAPLTAFAADTVKYIDREWDATKKEVVETEKSIDEYTVMTEDITTLSDNGWYVVNGDVDISSRIMLEGSANIILTDGCFLYAQMGIEVIEGKTLVIYGQKGEPGALYATNGTTGQSSIGGSSNAAGGTVIIKGGEVDAGCSVRYIGGSGIGGGTKGAGGTVTVYGGDVTAKGGRSGSGIGGGSNAAGGTLTVYGGTVYAKGGKYGAGIGGGQSGAGGTVTVNGGNVIVTGGESAAGIGGGKEATSNGTVTLSDKATVLAGSGAVNAAKVDNAAFCNDHSANYVAIGVPRHIHTFENGVCTDCDYRCTHAFENGVCTVCGMPEKITAGELCGLLNGQKFVNSDGLVLSIMDYDTDIMPVFGTSNLSTTSSAAKVPVTSYGYSLTVKTASSTNVFDFYTDAYGFSKVVCSGLKIAERNGEYYPYHPVAEVTVKDATCTGNGANTAYWICADEGCGKAFTDVSCKTEIPAETLATYIIPATGHDFTGDYVKGTGDNVGKHARKCVNTGCTAVGLGTTANAYEECTGMEDDFTCDLCGYVDKAAAAAAALAEAKAEAKTAVEALADDTASDEVKAIIEKALADIEDATSVSAVEAIADAAEKVVADQVAAEEAAAEAAKTLADAKETAKAEIDAAIEGETDEAVIAAAEVAKAAIDNARTVDEVEAAKNAGLEKMADASGTCPYCGQKEHKNWIDKFVCFIKRIFKFVEMFFGFFKNIKA